MRASAPDPSLDREAVLSKATLRAAERLGLRRNELSQAIGLSAATLSRMYAGKFRLDEHSKSWELASLMVRLYRGLDAILAGDERSVQSWMRNPNADLHETPVNLIGHVAGLANVVAYVDASRARI